MRKYKCPICGYIYDESVGVPEKGVAAGTSWDDLLADFVCPVCSAPKAIFKPFDEVAAEPVQAVLDSRIENVKELSPGEISAICASLAKGCEKQRLAAEMDAFNKLADYFWAKAGAELAATNKEKTLYEAVAMLDDDLSRLFPAATAAAQANADRGALRSLVWSEKVSAMTKSLLDRFSKEGDSMLENTRIYVCDICGFIYIGDAPPEICPVCKVPSYKIMQVERR